MQLGREDICAILEASAKAKVSKLKFGGLEVEFGSAPVPAPKSIWEEHPPVVDPSAWVSHERFSPASSPVTAITEEQKSAIAEALRRDEVMLKDDQLANALVEDPVLAEELIEEEMLNHTELTDVSGPDRE